MHQALDISNAPVIFSHASVSVKPAVPSHT
jgi:microsomal dipeptidase-like Zn-dependent dipeptidase